MIVGVDPSINTAGLAVLTLDGELVLMETVKSKKGLDPWGKMNAMIGSAAQIISPLQGGKIEAAGIEWPTEISWHRNANIAKLWYAVGRWDSWLYSLTDNVFHIPVQRVKPKGHTKQMTITNINLTLGTSLRLPSPGGKDSPDSHKADAARVAQYALVERRLRGF